ncbi:hypothetical protein SO802_018809 [Lithocarpus litseifolius]|uniref:YABBY N-terminal domain-containing protein n=1 Tax=Lithocarpus litseifolius TaxID=425828 RepID=A0AAW2CND9_9ROSI
MSLDMMASSERVCYVHCNFCNTILAVSVPCSSLFNMVTVRCGHCANLLSVNMGATVQAVPPQDPQKQHISSDDCGSSSKCNKFSAFETVEHEQPRMAPIRRLIYKIHSNEKRPITLEFHYGGITPIGSNLQEFIDKTTHIIGTTIDDRQLANLARLECREQRDTNANKLLEVEPPLWPYPLSTTTSTSPITLLPTKSSNR